MRIIVINGPNLNMLGIREPGIYGSESYESLCNMIRVYADKQGIDIELFQSNSEGAIIDKIHSAYGEKDGIVINPAGYTHTSVAILDALKAVNIPTVEVHISDINSREEFRKVSITGNAAEKIIAGHGFAGYIEAIDFLNR